jgi:hypothetical protein
MSPRMTWLGGDAALLRGTGSAMASSFARSIAVGALGVLLASPVSAQQVNGLSAAVRPLAPTELRNERSTTSDTSSVQSTLAVPVGGQRSAPVAGVLSFLIPGVGSFYAGNNMHGVIHLGIEVGAYLLVVSQANSCLNSIGTGTTNCKSNAGFVGGGALIILGNDIWSIFTAVHDANNHNGDAGKS